MIRKRSIEEFLKNNTMKELLQAVQKLEEKDRQIFELYYGLNGQNQQTVDFIAEISGYSKNYVNVKLQKIKTKVHDFLMSPQPNQSKESSATKHAQDKNYETKSNIRIKRLLKAFPDNSLDNLIDAASKLSKKEQEIFELYYGLNEKEPQPLEIIAQQYGYAKLSIQNVIIPNIKKKLIKILNEPVYDNNSNKDVEQIIKEIEEQIYNNTFDEDKLCYKVGNETIYIEIIDTKCHLAYKSNKNGLLDRIHRQIKKCLVYKISVENSDILDKFIIKDKKTNKFYKYVYQYTDGNYDLTGVLNDLVCFNIEYIKVKQLPSLNNNYAEEKSKKIMDIVRKKAEIEKQNQELVNEQKYKEKINEAIELIKTKDFKIAEEKLYEILKSKNPETLSDAYCNLGDIFLKSEKELIAQKYYLKSLQYNAKSYHSLLGFAKTLIEEENYEYAIKYLKKCDDLKTNHLRHYIELGRCYKKQKKYEEALECFNMVLEKYNDNYIAYYEKALLLYETQKYAEAEIEVQKSLIIDFDNLYSLVLLGKIYYLTNRQEEAFDIFNDILEKNNQNHLIEIGYFFHQLDEKELAYKYYMKIPDFRLWTKIPKMQTEKHIQEHLSYKGEKMQSIFHCPINLETLSELIKGINKVSTKSLLDIYQLKCNDIGTIYIDEIDKRPVNYLTIFTLPFSKKIVTAYPDYKLRSDKELKEITIEQINEIYENSIKPKAEISIELCEIEEKITKNVLEAIKLFQECEYDAAENIFQKCLISQSAKTIGKINYYLGEICIIKNKPLTAIKYYKNSLKQNKTYWCLCKLGKAYMLEGNYDDAIVCLNECSSLDSKRNHHSILLGQCYQKTKNYDKALEIFENLIEEDINKPTVHYNEALLFYELERYEEAIREINISLKLKPDNLFFKTLLGKTYYLTNKCDEALALFDEVVEKEIELNREHNISEIGYFFHQLGIKDLAYKYYMKLSNFNKWAYLTREEVNEHYQIHFSVPEFPKMHSTFNAKVSLDLLDFLIKDIEKVAIKPLYDVYQIKCNKIGKMYITKDEIKDEDYITILTAPFSKKIMLAYPDYKVYTDASLPTYTIEEIDELSNNLDNMKLEIANSGDETIVKVKSVEPKKNKEPEVIKEIEFLGNKSQVDGKEYLMNKLGTSDEVEFETYRNQIRMLINLLVDPEEQTVLLLSLGYIRNKFFNLKEISHFLNIEEIEVDNIINKGLVNINNIATNSLNSAKKILEIKKSENIEA